LRIEYDNKCGMSRQSPKVGTVLAKQDYLEPFSIQADAGNQVCPCSPPIGIVDPECAKSISKHNEKERRTGCESSRRAISS